jgi:hypothetical protein
MSKIKRVLCFYFIVSLTIFHPIESSASNKIVAAKYKQPISVACKRMSVKHRRKCVPDDAPIFTAYGPTVFKSGRGKPRMQTDLFDVNNPNTDYFIRIKKVDTNRSTGWWGFWRWFWRHWFGRGKPHKMPYVKVLINGKLVVGRRAFKRHVQEIVKPVSLAKENKMHVMVISRPHKSISIEIFGIDRDLPTISATVSPEPNALGWNNTDVEVSFVCDDMTSGVSSCPAPVTITQEGAGQVVTGEVVDNTGQTASLDVTVNLDRTPPQIGLTWPPIDQFGTDRNQVTLEGNVEDQLSGPLSLMVEDHNGSTNGMVPGFAVSRGLLTDIQPGEEVRESSFTLTAQDAAGNEAALVRRVLYTLGATVVPTDPKRAETISGVLTSYNRAMIQLASGTSRDRAHEIAAQHGGRVAGYLPFVDRVLVQFGTESVAELEVLLTNIEQESDVVNSNPVFFMTPDQFDNEELSPADAIAYTNIRLPEAIGFINDNQLSFNPVRIAIIDSGLDASYGRNGEFDNVVMYDLCTSEGRQGFVGAPVDLTGHGTRVTGIIAGANNGEGNNGIVSGLPNSDFDVSVFRTHCNLSSLDLDSVLIEHALNRIAFDSETDIDIVNMSFGNYSEDDFSLSVANCCFGTYINSIVGRDILWVASAGNDAREITCSGATQSPAALACLYGNVISVAGSHPNTDARLIASNHGDAVLIYAPGTHVYTATNSGEYGLVGGTSSSTAMVTGAAAIMKSVYPQESIDIRNAIVQSAQPMASSTAPQGRLDMYAMLQQGPLPPLKTFSNSGGSQGKKPATAMGGNGPMPGLSGFLLDYRDGDHHKKIIQAGYFPWDGIDDYIGLVDYQDSNGDDFYTYQLNGIALPTGTIYGDPIRGCSDNTDPGDYHDYSQNIEITPYDARYVPVLVGFRLYLDQNRDHHFYKMLVHVYGRDTPNGKSLWLRTNFRDSSPTNDKYCYEVNYALVPASRVRASDMVTHTTGAAYPTGSDTLGFDASQPVLQGFELFYFLTDHHVDQVGAVLKPNRVRVWLNDQNDDEKFSWRIHYVDLR